MARPMSFVFREIRKPYKVKTEKAVCLLVWRTGIKIYAIQDIEIRKFWLSDLFSTHMGRGGLKATTSFFLLVCLFGGIVDCLLLSDYLGSG